MDRVLVASTARVLGVVFCVLLGAGLAASESSNNPEIGQMVEQIAQAIDQRYVLPERGHEIAEGLRQAHAEGAFEGIENSSDLATALTERLYELSGDLHLRVVLREKVFAGNAKGPGPSASRAKELAEKFPGNFETKILEGGVGYLRVRILVPHPAPFAEALSTLRETPALILDLRECPGGAALSVRDAASHFFENPFVFLFQQDRSGHRNPIETLALSPDQHYVERPLVLLLSAKTGSGCESLAFGLKHHGRATLVGERTAGAGHGLYGMESLGHQLFLGVPAFRPVHPHFEGAFEGVGVEPDVVISAEKALQRGLEIARSKLMTESPGDDEEGVENSAESVF